MYHCIWFYRNCFNAVYNGNTAIQPQKQLLVEKSIKICKISYFTENCLMFTVMRGMTTAGNLLGENHRFFSLETLHVQCSHHNKLWFPK